jgi:acyl carrier protein
MTIENLQQEVFRIIADQLGVQEESIKLDSKFKEDLGADSLDTVEMVMQLEDHFNIEIEDDDAEKLDTPAKVIEFISKLK